MDLVNKLSHKRVHLHGFSNCFALDRLLGTVSYFRYPGALSVIVPCL